MATPNISLNNAKYFKGLRKKQKMAVDDEVFLRSDKMLTVLKGPRSMGVYGKFPVGDGSKKRQAGRESEAHAYTAWKRHKTGKGNYVLSNAHRNKVDDYMYVANLLYGRNWSRRVSFGVLSGNAERLTRPKGGRVFSTQMPQGISPWLKKQKTLLEKDILKAIRASNKPKGA